MPNPSPELVASERAVFARSPDVELRNVRCALSLHTWLNSAQESARLVAVKAIIAERAAAKRKGSLAR